MDINQIDQSHFFDFLGSFIFIIVDILQPNNKIIKFISVKAKSHLKSQKFERKTMIM